MSESEFLLDGSLSIGDLNDEFGLKLESEDYDTISGYLLEQLGYIPDEKHNGSVEAFGWQFSAARTEGNRICSVCMKRSGFRNRKQSGVCSGGKIIQVGQHLFINEQSSEGFVRSECESWIAPRRCLGCCIPVGNREFL